VAGFFFKTSVFFPKASFLPAMQTVISSVDPDETGTHTIDNLLTIMRSRWPGDPSVTGEQLM
jgi:hypothetical protein